MTEKDEDKVPLLCQCFQRFLGRVHQKNAFLKQVESMIEKAIATVLKDGSLTMGEAFDKVFNSMIPDLIPMIKAASEARKIKKELIET
jgi:hypothetical protein